MAKFAGLGKASAAIAATAALGIAGYVVFKPVNLAVPDAPMSALDPAPEIPGSGASAVPPRTGGDAPQMAARPVALAPAPPEGGAPRITLPTQEPEIALMPDMAPVRPTFDVVRIEPDGSALIAGRAARDALVTVLLDGARIAVEQADSKGGFVALVSIAPAAAPRVLSLSAKLGTVETASDQTVIVAPAMQEMLALATAPAGAPEPPAGPRPPARVNAPPPSRPQQDSPPDSAPELAETAPRLASVDAPEPGPTPTARIPDPAPAPVQSGELPTPGAGPAPDTTTAVPGGVRAGRAPIAPPQAVMSDPITGPNADIGPMLTAQPAQAPRLIVADQLGLRVIQDPGDAPQAMDNVSIDTITYDPSGAVILGGRGAAAAYVRVYLDNDPIRTTQINEDGQWRAQLPQIDTRVYTLRVDEIEADGAVISRTETPFQPEAPETAMAAAHTDTPVQVVTVQPGFTLWRIARENYGEGQLYVRVFEANTDKIRDPDLIYPGQIFTVPE
ncbi:LysM peptidoglycan-binding domain-containing protein [Oceaniglobus ichthyenteri]|uniref:LysM peptidoglycan-binding domain-containing protein n=1 Tax=Oceaniglobus ichthyenteri TaxID=2136177 RepID=UPI000F84AECC|nr:LysM peptidoglycan-binding domain-containing protein [Oceaniglobus ichthyenteri]